MGDGFHLYHYERSCRPFHNGCPTFKIETSPHQPRQWVTVEWELFYGGK